MNDPNEKIYLSPELSAAYPSAKRAILLCEGLAHEDSNWWPLVRRIAEEHGIDKVIEQFRAACLKIRIDPQNPTMMLRAREEFLTEDFRRFLMAKLGMM